MPNRNRIHFGPSHTPTLIKILISIALISNLLLIVILPHFPQFYSLKNPAAYLALSLWGIKHLFLWQAITYIFVPPLGYGFTLSFIVYLGFSLYLLWNIGTSVCDLKGLKEFIKIFFGGALCIGSISLFFLYAFHSVYPFSGLAPVIYCLLVTWIFLYQDVQLLLFFVIPIKAKWLIIAIASVDFLTSISSGNFIASIGTLSAFAYGYFYALFSWERPGPFYALRSFDRKMIQMKHNFLQRQKKEKIYDIKTGKTLDKDEVFMDYCLDKISRFGKNSLTFWEKRRMKRISKKRNKSK